MANNLQATPQATTGSAVVPGGIDCPTETYFGVCIAPSVWGESVNWQTYCRDHTQPYLGRSDVVSIILLTDGTCEHPDCASQSEEHRFTIELVGSTWS